MPARNEIYEQITRGKVSYQDVVRREYLGQLAAYTQRDTIVFSSAFTSYKPSMPMTTIMPDDIQGFMSALHELKRKQLDLILHSPGGSLEAADQIVHYLRDKYDHIRAIVPQNAMSAATMICCACDEIIMGKHSAIGPIDPQITFPISQEGPFFTAPAQSILDEFERAKGEIASNPTIAVLWIKRIDKYPHGFLKICQTTIDLAKERVAEWLEKWMFKSDDNAAQKASAIALWLGTADNHKTHGRPIGFNEAKEKGLNVKRLEDDDALQDLVLSVFHATMATHECANCGKLIENHNGKGLYLMFNVKN